MALLAGEPIGARYAAGRAPGTYLSRTTLYEYRELANAQVGVALLVLAIRLSSHLGSHPRNGYQCVIGQGGEDVVERHAFLPRAVDRIMRPDLADGPRPAQAPRVPPPP